MNPDFYNNSFEKQNFEITKYTMIIMNYYTSFRYKYQIYFENYAVN